MPKKILIIEDDHDILDMMKYILEDEGYEVVCFGQAASIAEIIAIAPQLILLDERLPGNPGHVLCSHIKADPIARSIPVILISAIINLESIVDDCKADNYLKKPFDIQDLTSLVNAYLL